MCSHEIAASTAQLVAASKVGPLLDSRDSEGLARLDHGAGPRNMIYPGSSGVGSQMKILPPKGPIPPSSKSLSSVSKEPSTQLATCALLGSPHLVTSGL